MSLIFFSTLVDYSVGLGLKTEDDQFKLKILLWISVVINLGFLGFFKYYNFFLENFIAAFSFFGQKISATSLNIILPVGISFYTFQTMSYTIDVYKRRLEPTSNFITFAAFVSFFPQLVAGPIERATNLLPQFYKKRIFDYSKAVNGVRQILWGLFKKVVIADNCAEYANYVFNNSSDLPGSMLVLGAVFFAFQIYGDFSGYSDIAIGTARLFGFSLMRNFAYPYFSRDIAEFWRRWHISLSTWFWDYLYIPLGGSRGGIWMKVRTTFIIFIVSGFWHGANWTFIVWGALNAVYFLPLLLTKNNRMNMEIVAVHRTLPTFKEVGLMLLTFALAVFAWIFFRAENLVHAFQFIRNIFSVSILTMPTLNPSKLLLGVLILVAIEWSGRREEFAIATFANRYTTFFRWSFYYILVIVILLYSGSKQEFIYFQF